MHPSLVDLESHHLTHIPTNGARPQGVQLVERLLEELGEDTAREGLLRTPERVWESLCFLTDGYGKDPVEVLSGAIFEESYDEPVVVRDIELFSMCEHHMLPFFGHAHIAYIPDGRIVGLSKLARVVDVLGRRLQVQERLTSQIADAVAEALEPRGVAVVIEAEHMCMMMRGVQKQQAKTITSALRGDCKTDAQLRSEVLERLQPRA